MMLDFNEEELDKFFRYCFSLTKNEDDAYDLLQSGLEKFLKSRAALGLESPKSYLYSILRNHFIDTQRHNARWRTEDIDDHSNVVLIDLESINETLIARDQTEMIMSHLAADEREILYLWAIEGRTIQDIAQFLSIPKGTLLSKLYRLKKRLKKLISADYPELAKAEIRG